MDSMFRKRLARLLWPRYSFNVDLVNRNAQMWREIETHRRLGAKEFATREQMYAFLNPQVPISYLEFGVWRGDSMRACTQLNCNLESRFYRFQISPTVGFASLRVGFNERWAAFWKATNCFIRLSFTMTATCTPARNTCFRALIGSCVPATSLFSVSTVFR